MLETEMRRQTRSILEEISSIGRVYDQKQLIEQTGKNLIASYGHVIALLRENFDAETADELERRLLSSLRTTNDAKFVKGLQKYSPIPRKSKKISSRLLDEDTDDSENEDNDSELDN